MAQQVVDMMELGVPLTTTISNIISRMLKCCAKLHRPRCLTWKGFEVISVLLLVACAVVWGILGQGAMIFTMVISGVIAALVLYGLCTYPRASRTVAELDKLALSLRDRVNSLKTSLEPGRPSVMFRYFSSKWESLDELDVCTREVMRLVSQMEVAMRDVNPRFISELKVKLQRCQQLLQKI